MNEFSYLPVDPNVFPIRYTYPIGDNEYEFEFAQNKLEDFITVVVRDQEDRILFSSRLIYGVPLNHIVVDGFPITIRITPFDLNDYYKDEFVDILVNVRTFGNQVKLYLGGEI
ncbi:hypothetical protein JWG45_07305 [Leptospira sp. 201903070]|uniref:Cyanophage baseplate Pam3 plug gp18 domain-containing protein n=1 Tax=Leptospira ainlahdjerensis TaxID=2810033 RepID=A0ABS2UAJ3_9LEPT|nr:hypothetical protein [Leptospira ainlahdjerensis]MBM9576958.1 hypothetical protein [Leptospira ainlahdjerensis]